MSTPFSSRLLVVDDNPAIHEDFRKILCPEGRRSSELDADEAEILGTVTGPSPLAKFELDSATQGAEGLAMLQRALESGRPYALAFVDMRMPPGWDGIETITQFWQVQPDLQVVICTAYSDHSWTHIRQRLGHSDNLLILKKPFDNVEVLQLAHALTRKWALAAQNRVRLEELHAQVQREMSERLQAEQSLRQAQKMEAIGQLASGVAHDFNNLLTIIQGHASLCLEKPMADLATVDSVKQIAQAAQRASALTRQLLAFGRKQMLQPRTLKLEEVVHDLSSTLLRLIGEHIELERQFPAASPVLVHADLCNLEQVIVNLAVNARDAMPKGGRLLIRGETVTINETHTARNPEAQRGRFVCLTVSDTGCGMDREVLNRIFEPFFTTKAVGAGTGLGLATVYGIVRQHGGWVDVTSTVGAGTTFKVYWPEGRAAVSSHAEVTYKPSGQGRGETILVVEDESLVRELVHTVLTSQGFHVLEAPDGVSAMKVWQTHRHQVSLLLTDAVMPGGMSGLELATELKTRSPGLKILMTSGYSPDLFRNGMAQLADAGFLNKPYSPAALCHAVRAALDGSAVPPEAAPQQA